MSKISVQDLVSVISKKHGITQKEAGTFISVLFDVVSTGLKTDRQVKIKGLGTFKVIDVRDRESVNVNTGERIVIDGRSKITFTPDALMRDLVNRPFAQFETVVINDGVDIEEFDKVDRQAEQLRDVNEQAVYGFKLEDAAITEDVQNESVVIAETDALQPCDTTEDEENQSYNDDEIVARTEYEYEVNVADEPNDEAQYASAGAEHEPEQVVSVAENVTEFTVEDTVPDMEEEPEAEEQYEDVPRHNVLKKILLLVFILLLIAGAAAYMGFYFGQRCATDKSVPVRVVETTVKKAVKTSAEVKKGSVKADSVKTIPVKDTVSHRDLVDVTNVHKETKGPVAEAVKTKERDGKDKAAFSDKYDEANVMVRTGAYRIVGVERTIVLKKGQTLSSVSKAILGPGMECYIEALNGVKEAKEGQTLKIPKLELRKKKKK